MTDNVLKTNLTDLLKYYKPSDVAKHRPPPTPAQNRSYKQASCMCVELEVEILTDSLLGYLMRTTASWNCMGWFLLVTDSDWCVWWSNPPVLLWLIQTACQNCRSYPLCINSCVRTHLCDLSLRLRFVSTESLLKKRAALLPVIDQSCSILDGTPVPRH